MDDKIVSIGKGAGPRGADARGIPAAAAHPLREVRAYWEALRDRGTIPARDAIDPRGIAGALEQVFMIERIAPGLARFRLVGSLITEIVGCEVRGMPFTALFDAIGRSRISTLLEELFTQPAIVHLELEAERGIGRPALRGQLLMLPLQSHLGKTDLALGCLALGGPIGRAPRRFAVSRAHCEKLVAPRTEPGAMPMALAEAPSEFVMPRPPRIAGGHLRLVYSAD